MANTWCRRCAATTLERAVVKAQIFSLAHTLLFTSAHVPHDLLWCFNVMFSSVLTFTGRRWDRPHWLWLHSQIAYISRRLTGSEGGCNLKTKPILCAPCQGWEMSADNTTKMCPSFSPEKGSFHFINSRLKRNYLPIDPNRQHKGDRTKKQFLLSALNFFYVVALLFSAL